MSDPLENNPALQFYEANYSLIANHILEVGKKVVLHDSQPGVCRFCGYAPPHVTYRKVAHAIPESLGNKSLSTSYECDTCNAAFGSGIENDFGNWSKPMRFAAQIRGKSGIPTLKKGSSGGWRLEVGQTGIEISQQKGDEIAVVDDANKKLNLTLRRAPYTPIAVAKALTKMALTVVPEAELSNFQFALKWIREPNHSLSPISRAPLIRTFVPGPRPFGNIVLMVLRRRARSMDVPYATIILAYGNEALQMTVPSPEQDHALDSKDVKFATFPNPFEFDPPSQGVMRQQVIDLNGRESVKGETFPLVFGYASGHLVDRGSD